MKKFKSINAMLALCTVLCTALLFGRAVHAANLECIVPSKPGGAMDLTCKLAKKGLQGLDEAGDTTPTLSDMTIRYLPGGIGAVAWNSLVAQPRAKPNTLVAFSGGSLLYLAEGKFGKAKVGDVRWVAALGTDYGMIAVRADSPYKNLGDLLAAIKRNPKSVLIGLSGTAGSQDWFKMALLVRRAGIDPKVLRFVALEGGGEAFTAMHANHVQVVSGDASEAVLYAAGGNTRVLAVLSPQRLPGVLASTPTALAAARSAASTARAASTWLLRVSTAPCATYFCASKSSARWYWRSTSASAARSRATWAAAFSTLARALRSSSENIRSPALTNCPSLICTRTMVLVVCGCRSTVLIGVTVPLACSTTGTSRRCGATTLTVVGPCGPLACLPAGAAWWPPFCMYQPLKPRMAAVATRVTIVDFFIIGNSLYVFWYGCCVSYCGVSTTGGWRTTPARSVSLPGRRRGGC